MCVCVRARARVCVFVCSKLYVSLCILLYLLNIYIIRRITKQKMARLFRILTSLLLIGVIVLIIDKSLFDKEMIYRMMPEEVSVKVNGTG